MAVGYQAPEDVINAALRAVGYPRPIAEIYEGSRASRVAVEIYGPTRDALLASQDWDFAYREVPMTLTIGGTPVAGFPYEYNYPADCLRVSQVRAAIPTPNNDPQPVRWKIENDQTLSPAAKTICTNVQNATLCYVGQITNPSTWNPGFSQAFVNVLAKIFAFALRDDINLSRTRAGLAEGSVAEAADVGDGMAPAVPELMARAARAAAAQ